ncbi:cyclase family protein [Microbacterium ulmi]|uniref:Cyclase family protein n=1 Tax=Microbacterium ulmi TaxID=179095 RepID=A0A7Y2M1T0_9MICO|nr:cyclase family protein [Microbacterium ulmi]NII69262.1 kynurenine formamidase [Microbacterium ulmi]NNH04941.1 cyclase family protein [Microbacterium ulmi]
MTASVAAVRVDAPADLSYAIDPSHFRWRGDRVITESLEDGAPFTTTRFAQSAHAFTHADAPDHVVAGGGDLAGIPVRTWTGIATVLDLTSAPDASPITAEHLQDAASRAGLGGDAEGGILLVRTDWDTRRDIREPAYWADAPWIDAGAAAWLRAQAPSAVGFDFPQDEPIRRAVAGEHVDPREFVTHHELLANGIGLVEYLRGLSGIPTRVLLCAAPIRLQDSDGGPARVVAFPLLTDHPIATPES